MASRSSGAIERQGAVVAETSRRLRGGGQEAPDLLRVCLGPQAVELRGSEWCRGKAAYGLDHPIELEGLQGTCVHERG